MQQDYVNYIFAMHHSFLYTIYALIFAGLNFRGLPIFAVFMDCDIIAQALPVWSEFSWDETFAEDY